MVEFLRPRINPPCINVAEHRPHRTGTFCVMCGLVFDTRRPKYKRGYGTKTRADMIRRIVERDGFNCWYCEYHFESYLEVTIDHVRPKSKGGPNDIKNYRLACYWCNHHKGNMTVTAFKKLDKFKKRRAEIRAIARASCARSPQSLQSSPGLPHELEQPA